jgi:RimJ/RimL family protein N-acetyltransferase
MRISLETDRIKLRLLKRSDAETLHKYAKDKAISRYTFLPRPYLLEHSYKFIKESRLWFRRKRNYALTIEWKETGEVIGMIGLHHLDFKNKNAELGYWLARRYWGRGITKEAIGLILKYGFREMKFVRIYARVMRPNIASSKLLEKCGFAYEGRLRKAVLQRGRWMDMLCYGKLKTKTKEITC